MGSSPVAVTYPSDFMPSSSKEFLDIQATIEDSLWNVYVTWQEHTVNFDFISKSCKTWLEGRLFDHLKGYFESFFLIFNSKKRNLWYKVCWKWSTLADVFGKYVANQTGRLKKVATDTMWLMIFNPVDTFFVCKFKYHA